MYTLGEVGTIAFCVFVLGIALDTVVKRWYARKLESALVREVEQARVARWLANYNYGLYVAVQEVMMKQSSLSYYEVNKLIKLELAEPCGRLNQLVPTEIVPADLHEAAAVFNQRTMTSWPIPYIGLVGVEGADKARIRQLEDAIVAMRWNDGVHLHDYEHVAAIAKQAGVSYLQTESIVRTLMTNAYQQVNHILGLPDPEEVLPSIY